MCISTISSNKLYKTETLQRIRTLTLYLQPYSTSLGALDRKRECRSAWAQQRCLFLGGGSKPELPPSPQYGSP
jgi:hypothetical protein